MAARTIQINSFCGGSSKLADSEFLGMEESLNMYPETVTATDSYTTKVLKSVEGFNKGPTFESNEKYLGMGVVNSNPWSSPAIKESFLVVTRTGASNDCKVWNIYGGTKAQVGSLSSGSGERAIVEELSNGVVVFTLGGSMYSADPTSTTSPAPVCVPIVLPDAFDHAGKVKPTQLAQLNFRLIVNDEDSDYIYWSEINRPRSALDIHPFEQSLTQYAYTKTDGTVVTFSDNVFYAPSAGTYNPNTLTTQTVYTSALNSMKMDLKADKVVALRATDTSLFVFGNNSLQVLRWQNSTSAPFAIVAKSSLAGVAFADAVAVVGNECFFVGKGPQGMLGVFAVDENCNIRKVSTNAVDQRLAKYAAITHGFKDIRTFTYTYKGHQFFVFTAVEYYDEFEGTMAYDVGEDVWTDRASFDENGDKFAWCAVDAHHIEGRPTFVTKTRGGKYRLAEFVPNSSTDHWLEETADDLNYYIVKERTTGIKYDGVNDIVVTSLELVMNAGATMQTDPSKQGYNPRVMLQVSNDGGRTWSNELWAYAGKVGQYSWRVRWNGLGRGARFAFRVRMTDPVAFEIATAYLSYLPCGNRV